MEFTKHLLDSKGLMKEATKLHYGKRKIQCF